MLSSITAVYRTITLWNKLPSQENILSEFEAKKESTAFSNGLS